VEPPASYLPIRSFAAIGLKIGDVVSAEQIQAAADRLAALGIFSRSTITSLPTERRSLVEFQVQEAPTSRFSFDDFPGSRTDEIAAAIVRR